MSHLANLSGIHLLPKKCKTTALSLNYPASHKEIKLTRISTNGGIGAETNANNAINIISLAFIHPNEAHYG